MKTQCYYCRLQVLIFQHTSKLKVSGLNVYGFVMTCCSTIWLSMTALPWHPWCDTDSNISWKRQ